MHFNFEFAQKRVFLKLKCTSNVLLYKYLSVLVVVKVLKINLLVMADFAVSCSKAKKGKADANASKTPLRHFVPPPPQRGEEFSPFGPFLPFCTSVKKRN